jgi:hypothetical protein
VPLFWLVGVDLEVESLTPIRLLGEPIRACGEVCGCEIEFVNPGLGGRVGLAGCWRSCGTAAASTTNRSLDDLVRPIFEDIHHDSDVCGRMATHRKRGPVALR